MCQTCNDPPPGLPGTLVCSGACVWFTGLSGAGKTTLAHAVQEALLGLGMGCVVLDGDTVRSARPVRLGFSRADRDSNVADLARRASHLVSSGALVLVAAISPYRAARTKARAAVECRGRFVEVHVDVPVAVAAARDPKGLYARAAMGELRGLTGIDDPYEPPDAAEVTLQTASLGVAQCTAIILDALRREHIIRPAAAAGAVPG